ncbi:MAG TPA: chemotaxis-specific protein-glutamate methyltransferase CheB [Vicinamibacterales bacterium]|nr:chemotaxis-specific protein-glutamate methyltransferase CheB [Vicinamibacterales bacterium]
MAPIAPGRVVSIVRVLVVDDSAYVRKMMTQMLTRSPFVDVIGTARDGKEALEMTALLKPDVITCDLNMPEMDGVAFVRQQMAARPVPIVIISVANPSGEEVLAALEAGAVDFLQKPTALATDRLLDVADELVSKVKAAAGAQLWRVPPATLRIADKVSAEGVSARHTDILLIGISTGGPQALKSLIPQLPADFPIPVAMVLHMPVGYTELYAKKLDELSNLRVKEPYEGEVIEAGTAYLAPAGRHLSFRRAGGSVIAHLDVRPLDTPHRPAVDVLFQSAAEVYGARVMGVVMTGMGADGREGSAWIKARGGQVITEAEQSCVVYGMPRSVVEAGLSDVTASLEDMFRVILERL